MYPRIELHIRLEAIARAGTLLQMARPNDVPRGAPRDERTRSSPQRIGAEFDWTAAVPSNEAV